MEVQGADPVVPTGTEAFQVCAKLRPQLATLMGGGGFRALLSRALAVAHAEAPWLRAVQVKPDGSLELQDGHEAPANSEAVTEAGVVLVAQLVGLLVAFIGEDLTMRMLRDVWPKLPHHDLDLSKGDRK